ncbi:MAG TPA: CDP-glycerol glycerophosphotransferase family protein [Candidatus Thermoplasmatota archaeon]|nr:CDP-glycerol glycerophosphotransferase family protein [Candidatus Thermoplasmatota archaeon]
MALKKTTVEQLAHHIITFYNEYDLRVSGRINNLTAFQLIETIEKQFDTDAIMLPDGTKLWNLVRVFLYSNFQSLGEQASSKKSRMSAWKPVLSIIKESLQPLRLQRQIPVCGFSSSESRKLYNDTYYDIYLDPLYEILGDRLTVFEWPETTGARRDYDRPIYSRHYVPMHIPITTKAFWTLLLHQLTGRRTYTIQGEQTLKNILMFISTTASVDNERLTTDIYDFFTVFFSIKQFLSSVLQHVRPRVVLIRCGYGRFPMALSQACRELRIPSIELQHGLITAYLPAYRRTTPTTNQDCIPEYLLAQGDIYASLVREGNLFDPNKVISTGYPYLEKKLGEKHENRKLKQSFSRFPRNLLFTSQWIVAKEIQEFVVSVADLLEQQKLDVGILFKPHPYDRTDYTQMQRHDHLIPVDKYEDTFKLFALADLHSTVYSTSGLEAMAFAVPNIFVDIYKLTKGTNTSYIVSTPEEFVTSIRTILSSYEASSRETKAVADLFFTPSPNQRFTDFFRTMGLL